MTEGYVYRLFDAAGELLYVGASRTPLRRLRAHQSGQAWWPEVDLTKLQLERFPSQEEAFIAELQAIRSEHPKFNIEGKLELPEEAQHYESMPSMLVTLEEIAAMAHVSIHTVRHWRRTGQGPKFARIGKRVLARRTETEAWIDSHFREVG